MEKVKISSETINTVRRPILSKEEYLRIANQIPGK